MIHKAGAGPKPIPAKKLNTEGLRDAILFAISPSAKRAASQLAQQIQAEVSHLTKQHNLYSPVSYYQDGVRKGVDSFYRHLPLLNMRCDIEPSKLAVWWSTDYVRRPSCLGHLARTDAPYIVLKTQRICSTDSDQRRCHQIEQPRHT